MIMGHSKHELTQYKNSCCAPEEKIVIQHTYLSTGATFFSPQAGSCGEVRLQKRQSSLLTLGLDTMIQCTSIITMCRKDHISMRF